MEVRNNEGKAKKCNLLLHFNHLKCYPTSLPGSRGICRRCMLRANRGVGASFLCDSRSWWMQARSHLRSCPTEIFIAGAVMKQSELQRFFGVRILRQSSIGAAFFALVFTAACDKVAPTAPAAPVVEVVTVAQRDVPIYMEWIGSLDGNVNAVIRPQVTGYLIKQNYREGDLVKKGQPLFEIDPRTFEAAVQEAKGMLAQHRLGARPPRPTWRGSSRWRRRTPSARRTLTTPSAPTLPPRLRSRPPTLRCKQPS